MKPIFNYIITIHNKEELIREVMNSVIKCCNQNSFIYPVLDGCTDRSEEIVDEVIEKNSKIVIKKIKLNDVHEIRSINEGLMASDQIVEGYNIILQDDVILLDFSVEEKIIQLYEKIGQKLGYVSFRLGGNLKFDALGSKDGSPFTDYIENAFGHGMDGSKMLLPGQFAFRSVAIKSPICIPTSIIKHYGLFDENLCPCFHDDTEYCLRLIKHGYKNGVFGIEYQSDLDWGGTRKNPNPDLYKIIRRNMDYIRQKYPDLILEIISSAQDKEIVNFEEFTNKEANRKALHQFKINRKKRMDFERRGLSINQKIKYYIQKIMN